MYTQTSNRGRIHFFLCQRTEKSCLQGKDITLPAYTQLNKPHIRFPLYFMWAERSLKHLEIIHFMFDKKITGMFMAILQLYQQEQTKFSDLSTQKWGSLRLVCHVIKSTNRCTVTEGIWFPGLFGCWFRIACSQLPRLKFTGLWNSFFFFFFSLPLKEAVTTSKYTL